MSELAREPRSPDSDHAVVAIVVTYRAAALTTQCVESLLQSAGVRPRIIIVDNASGDDSVERLRARFGGVPSITVVARDVNDGYTGGNNAGMAIARQLGARFAFILNNDTVVDANCLRLLVEDAERDARIALVTPRIFFGDDRECLWFGGGRFSLWMGRPVHVGLHQRAADGWTERRDISFASGCALLVRLAAVSNRVFDASLFTYAEDLDLVLRVRAAGHRVRYVPAALVWHYEGSGHRRAGGQSLRFYLNTRNLLRVNARHAHWYHWITLAPMLAVDVVGRYLAVAVRDRNPGQFVAVLRGAWHSVSGGKHSIETERDARP